MKNIISIPIAAASLLLTNSCTPTTPPANLELVSAQVREQTISYSVDTLKMNSYLAYDENLKGTRPAVLVVHEWWGLNEYTKRRTRELAELGYVAMAVDMYGNDRHGDDPGTAGALAMPYYKDPQLAKTCFDAALSQLKKDPRVDTTRIAAMGYCFGGGMVLNIARMGEDLRGVVSFHGSLLGVLPDKNTMKADVLVLHGADDQFVLPADVAQFRHEMDSAGVAYTFIEYPGATHAFTNPEATANGEKFHIPIAYNAAADTASWKEMKTFFDTLFK